MISDLLMHQINGQQNNYVIGLKFDFNNLPLVDLSGQNVFTNNGIVLAKPSGIDDDFGYFNTSAFMTSTYNKPMLDWWTEDVTIEDWVYADSFANWSYLDTFQIPSMLGNANPMNGENYWSFGPRSDRSIGFYYWAGNQNIIQSSPNLLNLSAPNHIAFVFVYATKTAMLFVNGILCASVVVTKTPLSGNEQPFSIGKINNRPISGYVNNLQMLRGAKYLSNFVPLMNNLN